MVEVQFVKGKPISGGLLGCRGDYGIDVGRNIIHGSDAVEVIQYLCLGSRSKPSHPLYPFRQLQCIVGMLHGNTVCHCCMHMLQMCDTVETMHLLLAMAAVVQKAN